MRYSLCSRFRGTLLGAAVGGMLTHTSRDFFTVNTEIDANISSSTTVDIPWERLGTAVAQSLIQKEIVDVGPGYPYFSNTSRTINPIKVILASLPIALFYHDNETQLQSNLRQFVAWQHDPEIVAGILAVGYAIALSLQEKLQTASLIPLVVRFIEAPQLLLTQQLIQVKSLLEHQASLAKAVAVLGEQPSSAIALAFYCFLSSREDFQLSVKRAAIWKPHISSITGALSGAYNATYSIPVNWRLALSCSPHKPLAVWGMHSEAEMLRLCDSLVAVWSGAYNHTGTIDEPMAIAAPHVIRPR
ncbi:ADP-ribosylglycohydrolase family protein [Gloeocapsopsis dulcis]|uniref:ADP-ribosylglycohydrolase n=1 Tax=Gloeocapsopsis dulcis AAB1 = 1H9 TaxID=1433147 RepID=A0A6N8FQP1_9CHRO|nr:ADP-ribosylglycohydrolase family protein [Gloeocapsopsis dulcis]MUL35134.1 hypothetical protein [Gloeocapsopsis dulcis AAB1 = 1H9]WNN89016.1 ADP-ribosylglycohydrolase family protein [Gloeocapsopsis dulcis]